MSGQVERWSRTYSFRCGVAEDTAVVEALSDGRRKARGCSDQILFDLYDLGTTSFTKV